MMGKLRLKSSQREANIPMIQDFCDNYRKKGIIERKLVESMFEAN